jgi:hypothetical protein
MNTMKYPELPTIVGCKVVCIDDQFPSAVYRRFNRVPQENQIYTVSAIFWCPEHGTKEPLQSVQLAELPPVVEGPGKCGFSLWRFRLLNEEKASATFMPHPSD